MQAEQSVVIVGGGYAGALAAARLARVSGVRVTLIAPGGELVHRVELHRQLARVPPAAMRSLRALVGPDVALIDARARSVDVGGRRVDIGDRWVPYDALIVATGSGPGLPGGAHAQSCVVPVDLGPLKALRGRLPALARERAAVVVVGGGPTAMELAGTLGENWPGLKVQLVAPHRPLQQLGARAARLVARRLAALGVRVTQGLVVGCNEHAVEVEGASGGDASELPADVVVWAAGFGPGDPAGLGLGLEGGGSETAAKGRTAVLPTLQWPGSDRIFVVGDAAELAIDGQSLPMGCKTAMPMAATAADNALRVLQGADPQPHRFVDPGACVAIGARWAVATLEIGRDARAVGGLLGGAIKALLTAYVLISIRWQARGWLRYRWLLGGGSSSVASTVPASTGLPADLPRELERVTATGR